MKYLTWFILLCLLVINCTSNKSDTSNDKTARPNKAISDAKKMEELEGEIIWQQDDAYIKVIKNNKPQFLLYGFNEPQFRSLSSLYLKNNGYMKLFSGTIKEFGDLDKDGSPEFLIEDLQKTDKATKGYRIIISPALQPILHIVYHTKVDMNFDGCTGFVGINEELEFDGLSEGSPYLIVHSKFGFNDQEEGCETYQKVEATMFVMQEKEVTYQKLGKGGCIVEDGKINLERLFSYSAVELEKRQFNTFDYDKKEALITKFKWCVKNSYETINSVKGLNEINSTNENPYKRTDLMPYLKDEFVNVNGKILIWARKTLIPRPNQKQGNGLLYSYIYNKGYKNRIRALALVRLVIEQEDIESLLSEYVDSMATKFYNKPTKQVVTKAKPNSLITDKYWWLVGKLNKIKSFSGSLSKPDYGFFMRRILDGSDPEIWETLTYILKQYDQEWYKEVAIYTLSEVDSTTYEQASMLADGYEITNKADIPADLKIDTLDGVRITARNNKEVTFTNNIKEGKNIALYSIKGYWPKQEMIMINYIGLEWNGSIVVDINTGKRVDLESNFHFSKNGKQVVETKNDYGQISLQLSKFNIEKIPPYFKTSNSGFKGQIKEGFWVGNDYYFVRKIDTTQETLFYKVGKFGLDDIRPHIPPFIQK